MVGYPESLTDPSYRGQILVLTYPMVGNYGVFSEADQDANGLPYFFESSKIHISGLIVGTYYQEYSHWRAIKSLSAWLKEHNIPAIHGVDTRALTKKIRTKGVMLAKLRILADPHMEKLQWNDPNVKNLVAEGVRNKKTKPHKSNRLLTTASSSRFCHSFHQRGPSVQAHTSKGSHCGQPSPQDRGG